MIDTPDVPSPIDFHDPVQARDWEQQTIARRPARPRFFAAFVGALNRHSAQPCTVLELGSGPGHLAEAILQGCAVRRYVALDFAQPMHDLARQRLGALAAPVAFVQRDFRSPDWPDGLGRFDAVLTMQAAHETRHRRRLPALLAGMRRCLVPGGVLLFCDHYAGPGKHADLYLPAADQGPALQAAGFTTVEPLLDEAGMALYAARNGG